MGSTKSNNNEVKKTESKNQPTSTKFNNNKVNKTKSRKQPTVHYRIFQYHELKRRCKPDDVIISFCKHLLLDSLTAIDQEVKKALDELPEDEMDTELDGDK